jgi:hypothetical protein
MKTEEIIKKVMACGIISESEVSILKRRKNAGEKFDESFSWDNEIELTDEQNKKGIDFLMNQWKTSSGRERKNNPFGFREQDILKNFTHFEFMGFYDAGNYKFPYYIPLYRCCSKDNSFKYYYNNGNISIIG